MSAAPLESTSSENNSSDKSHIQNLLLRPSPINPDVPNDPKPPERIILDDSKTARDRRSVHDNEKLPSHGHESHDNPKTLQEYRDEHKDIQGHDDDKRDDHSSDEHLRHDGHVEKHDEHKEVQYNHDNHDHKRETNTKLASSDEHKDDHPNCENKSDKHSHDDDDDVKSGVHLDTQNDGHDNLKRETDVKVLSKEDLKPKEISAQPDTHDKVTIVYPIKTDEKRSAADGFETSHRIPDVDESERTFETSHHIPTHIEEERKKVVENEKVADKH